MSEKQFDFCIVGAGAAGLHLALAMSEERFFEDKNILLLDKSSKDQNDRTWCFWEKGKGKWDDIIDHKWEEGHFFSAEGHQELKLPPYSYKKLPGISFYNHAKKVLSGKANVEWLTDEVNSVKNHSGNVQIIGKDREYRAKYCFDSRIDEAYFDSTDNYIRILQHFKGWEISFKEDVFNPKAFTMMDFRLRHDHSSSFSYVLPVSKRSALVEFTLFTSDLLPKMTYDKYLKEYIEKYISTSDYEIKDVEYGVIPMSNYPFHQASEDRIMKIGTAGSWVRASTGYSFKYAEKYAQTIIRNFKKGEPPNKGLLSKKFRMYDSILLEILRKENHLGPKIFSQLYQRNKVATIFSFLDGETNFLQDVLLIGRLNPLPFLRALGRLFRKNF